MRSTFYYKNDFCIVSPTLCVSVFDGIATTYDLALWPLEVAILRRLRARLIKNVHGQVLEIGAGTGANLPYYTGEARVFALDASADMLRMARRRPCQTCATATQADGQILPFANNTFDMVLATLVFCSVSNPLQAMAEIKRVMKHGGLLLLMEHTRGVHPITRWLTDTFHPVWYKLNGSCHLNRETARTVAQAGFVVTHVERRFGGIVQLIYGERTNGEK
jgi:ubiquinone/menaquinone biosynthesis C-methylase UbiE